MSRQLRAASVRNIMVGLMVVIAAFGRPFPAAAAENNGNQYITITPATNTIDVDPGGQKTGKITVVNQGKDAFSVKLSVMPYSVKGIDYEPQYSLGDADKADASKWVTLSTDGTNRLEPYKLLDVTYTVNVPSNAPAGGHYFVVFAESAPLEERAGITAHNRVGQIVYMNVNGDIVKKGEASLTALPSVITDQKTQLPITLKNTGTTHFVSKTQVVIKDIFGKTVLDTAQNRYILPGTERRVVFDWDNYSPAGVYKVTRSAALPDGTTVSGTTTVITLNLLVVGGVVIALLLLVGIAILRHRARRH